MDNNILLGDLERYQLCWFEIKTNEKSIVMRDCKKFLRKSEALSRTQEIRLYKIEKGTEGLKKSRVHSALS